MNDNSDYLKRRTMIIVFWAIVGFLIWNFLIPKDGLIMLIYTVIFCGGMVWGVWKMDQKGFKKSQIPKNTTDPKNEPIPVLEENNDDTISDGRQSTPRKEKKMISYYGVTIQSNQEIKYEGPLENIPLDGSDIPLVINQIMTQAPSGHLLILPQSGLLISIGASGRYTGQHFQSSINSEGLASIMSSMLEKGGKVKMIEEYGAVELVW